MNKPDKLHGQCLALLEKYGKGQNKKNEGMNVTVKLEPLKLNAQAVRSASLVKKLGKGGAVVLGDPTGTGKTPVALVAASVLMSSASANSAINTVLIVAPNQSIAELWTERAEYLFGEEKVFPWSGESHQKLWVNGKCRVVVTTRNCLHKKGSDIQKPKCPNSVLIIVDEAHRGGIQDENNDAHQALKAIAAGAKLLLVTATPFQIDVNAMTNMLGLASDQNQDSLNCIKQHGIAIKDLISCCGIHHNEIVDTNWPAAVELAVSKTIDLQADAHKALSDFILEGFDPKSYGIEEVQIKLLPNIELKSDSMDYDIARCLPELSGRGGNRSMVQRELVSSSEAFLKSAPIINLPGHVEKLKKKLEEGEYLLNHPKITATCKWIKEKYLAGRHVLVFCVFIETQNAIASALIQIPGLEVYVPKGSLNKDMVTRFRKKDSKNPLVIVVTDRFSESIDLDGGNPCIVHHDLPWNPARMRQRHGRVVRISSNFKMPAKEDIYIPILNVEVDIRQFQTVMKRQEMGDHLLMGIDGREPTKSKDDPWALPDAVLDRLKEGRVY